MIYLAKRLAAEETDADKQEFVQGVMGSLNKSGTKKALAGIAAGYILSKALRKNG